MTPENCPACGRELSELRDFPNIEVKSVELLPIPEKILHWSSTSLVEVGDLQEEDLPDELKGATVVVRRPIQRKEVDLTEEIKGVIDSESIQQYLDALQQTAGLSVETSEVLPPLKKGVSHGHFQFQTQIISCQSATKKGKKTLQYSRYGVMDQTEAVQVDRRFKHTQI